MSRGARRRSGRGRKRSGRPVSPSQRPQGGNQRAATETELPGRSRRRRRGGSAVRGLGDIIDKMSARPGTLTTLPPDGTVLEEVIADLEGEYGTPVTPQEYRLVIKVAPPDESNSGGDESPRRREEETPKPESARRRRRVGRRHARRKAQAKGESDATGQTPNQPRG